MDHGGMNGKVNAVSPKRASTEAKYSTDVHLGEA